MSRSRSSVSPQDTYLELLVTEKIRIGDSIRNEETLEYMMNINRALDAYSEEDIRKMKAFVETKQKKR